MPSLDGAIDGSTRRRSPRDELRGKVVLVDFWTYSCINCLRTMPYVRAWAREVRRPGPGGDRRARAGVRLREGRRQRASARSRISASPIRSRSTTTTPSGAPSTTATGPRTTSSMRRAASATTISAKASYDDSERVIQQLLAEAGNARAAAASSRSSADGRRGARPRSRDRAVARNLSRLRARRELRLAGRQRRDAAHVYCCRRRSRLNQWALVGRLDRRRASTRASNDAGRQHRLPLPRARPAPRARAAADGKPVRFRVLARRQAAGRRSRHGRRRGRRRRRSPEQRLYQLVRQTGDVGERTFEIEFLDPGVQAYAFTFG